MRLLAEDLRFPLSAAVVLLAAWIPARAQSAGTAEQHSTATPIEAAKKLSVSGVHNAGKVNDSLYRGAQPAKKGFVELKKLGVTAVVNLRTGQQGPAEERKEVESLKMSYVNIPVSGWSPPSNAQVAQFLALFKNSEGQKIFVHCHFGDDRTGVMIATYRIAVEHWTADQAIQEMLSFGFHHHWHPKMEAYVRNFPQALTNAPEFAVFRSNPEQH
jgi:tyrosine-protein phosphatase SIW14